MGGLSLWHWALVVGVVGLMFGGSRVKHLMGEVGKGLRTMRTELIGPTEEEKKDERSKDS
jgi:sec-independent protein translocase protein TatA